MTRRRQRGAALILLLAVLTLGGVWYLISGLHARSGDFTSANRAHNARVLNRAKQALIGYVAAQAAKGGLYPEDNPGALPCPEHSWYIDYPDKEGASGPSIGVASPGYGTANCSSIGRFPWRTIGTEKFLDARAEPLWYVVGPTWRKTSSSTKTTINSNTAGDLALDGQQAVALIIAPGAAINMQSATTPAGMSCTARNQSRSAPSSSINPLDYLECYDATTLQFSSSAASTAFNDQVVKITLGDVLPAIEAAVANRFERDIAAAIRFWPSTTLAVNKAANATALTVANTVGMAAADSIKIQLANGTLGATTISAVNSSTSLTLVANTLGSAATGAVVYAAGSPVAGLPFAAAFADPTTSAFKGAAITSPPFQGLLPLTYSETSPGSGTACAAGAGAPRCDPLFVAWQSAPAPTLVQTGGTPTLFSSPCTVGTASSISQISCTVLIISVLAADMNFRLQGTAQNAGMALRQFNTAATMQNVAASGRTVSAGLNTDGSATISLNALIPASAFTMLSHADCIALGIAPASIGGALNCLQTTITVPMTLLADHPLFDSTNSSFAWFMRNKWYEVSYYAVASGIAPSGTGSCTTSVTCLQVTYHRDKNNQNDEGKPRGIIVIAGRSLSGAARPNGTLSDWLEGVNCRPVGAGCPLATSTTVFALRSPPLVINGTFNDRIAVVDSN